jgi:hypothetical protein
MIVYVVAAATLIIFGAVAGVFAILALGTRREEIYAPTMGRPGRAANAVRVSFR